MKRADLHNQFFAHERWLDIAGRGSLFIDTPMLRGIGFLLEKPDNVQIMADQLNERHPI